MSSKVVKIRKPHLCDWCGREGQPGEQMRVQENRRPKYGDDDWDDDGPGKQIGIEFERFYQCADEVACDERRNAWDAE